MPAVPAGGRRNSRSLDGFFIPLYPPLVTAWFNHTACALPSPPPGLVVTSDQSPFPRLSPRDLKMQIKGAVSMTGWLRTLAAPTEDPCSIHSTHICSSQPPVTPASENSEPSSGPAGTHVHMHIYIHVHTHIHKN